VRKLTLIVLLINVGLIVLNGRMLWRNQAFLDNFKLCHDGIRLAPGDSCYIKFTAPEMRGQNL
jgi:hypothetical protein